jgi:hypothetical protein
MDHDHFEAWEPQKPPGDFASKVLTSAQTERPASVRPRSVRIAAAMLIATTIAALLALAVRLKGAHAHGDVTSASRQEVRVGRRALAVLEPGAHVTWDGDAIAQSDGDAFWRVEPGAQFVLHTPGVDVVVRGTCFRVRVTEEDRDLNVQDAKGGPLRVARTVFVDVYEGEVEVSQAGLSLGLVAGESARADPGGVNRVPRREPHGLPVAASVEASSESEKTTTGSAANLAERIRRYRSKLDALEREREYLQKQLDEAQSKTSDGGARLGH